MQVVIDNRMTRVTMPASIKSLVVDHDAQRRVLVEELLSNMGYSTLESCASISELTLQRQSANGKHLLVLCANEVNGNLINQLKELLKNHSMPVLMLAEDIDKEAMADAMKAGVTAFLSLGIQGNRIKQAIDSAFANFSVVTDLHEQIEGLKTRLDDRIVIEKAKGLIMKNRSLDEEKAYAFLRDYAMKNGKKLVDVAQMMIVTAELLDK